MITNEMKRGIMKKTISYFYFLILLLLLLSANLMASTCEQGGTEVFGPIYEDTIWTKANSPYCITKNIYVLSGITLTIEPGVKVLNSGIFVDGQLIARGTKNENILFTPGYIKFTEKAIASSVDSNNEYQSGCILQHVTINNGGGIYIEKSPYLDHVSFQSTTQAIYTTSSLIITNCIFTNNGPSQYYGGAIYAESTLTVINSNFSHNQDKDTDQDRSYSYGGAIYAKNDLTIINSSFSHNSTYASSYKINPSGGAYSHGGAIYAEKKLTVTDSSFINNTTYAEALSEVCRPTLSLNGAAIYSKDTLIVMGSKFTQNTSSYWYKSGNTESFRSEAGVTISGEYIEITNSLFNDNLQSAISLQSGKIINSTITNNSSVGISIAPSSVSPIITGCNIFENGTDMSNNSSNIITATGNYWGTTDINEIFAQIYDRFDNPKNGEINFGVADKSYLTEFNNQAASIPSSISIQPENYTYSDTMLGSSESQLFTIINKNDVDLAIENLSITGNDSVYFGFMSDNCSNKTLLPEESCTIDIFFSPTTKGEKNAIFLVNKETKVYIKGTGYIFSIFGRVSTNIAGHENLNFIGATVKLSGTNYTTITDSQGKFILELGNDIKNNNYSLIYSSPHFTTFKQEIYLETGKDIEIEPISLKFVPNIDVNFNGVLDMGDIIYQLQLLTN